MLLSARPQLSALVAIASVLAAAPAFAQRASTQDALARMEETLTARAEDGVFDARDMTPAIVVSVLPSFEETKAWYPNAALASLARVFGAEALRACEACMSPRLYVQDGRLEQNTSSPDLKEIIRIDENSRGTAPPAHAAIWLDETVEGVSLRIIDLRNGRIVYAENFDAGLTEMTRSTRNFTLTRELERRARGDALTHTFLDAAIYPGQHLSLDFTEQWGDDNANLSGVTLSLFDPIVGVGGAYYRVIPKALNIMIGVKVLMSVPTALIQALQSTIGQNGTPTNLFDPLLTGVAVVRIPIGTSNYGVILTASTNGRVGVGFSLMNLSLLPVLP